jgi:hypothetical protein
MMQLSTGSYTSGSSATKLANCIADASSYDVTGVPVWMQGMTIRIARIVIRRDSGGRTYWVYDRRGQPLGTSGGGSSSSGESDPVFLAWLNGYTSSASELVKTNDTRYLSAITNNNSSAVTLKNTLNVDGSFTGTSSADHTVGYLKIWNDYSEATIGNSGLDNVLKFAFTQNAAGNTVFNGFSGIYFREQNNTKFYYDANNLYISAVAASFAKTVTINTNLVVTGSATVGTLTASNVFVTAGGVTNQVATIDQLGATPISTLSTGAVITVTPTPQKKIYDVSADVPITLFTNNIAGLNANGTTNYEWVTRINYTSTNALSTAWDGRIQWEGLYGLTPDLTVTGRYEFAFSTSDGVTIQGRQTYPTVYPFSHIPAFVNFVNPNSQSFLNYSEPLWIANGATNTTQLCFPVQNNYTILKLSMRGSDFTNSLNTITVKKVLYGSYETLTYQKDFSAVGQTPWAYKPLNFMLHFSGDVTTQVAPICFALTYYRNSSLNAVYAGVFLSRPANELEIKAYSGGWRP